MTAQTIKDLYYGNLNLFDRTMAKDDEYFKAVNESAEAKIVLEATLNDEQKHLLNIFVDKCAATSCHLEYSAFLVGYKVASRLLAEAIYDRSHEQ